MPKVFMRDQRRYRVSKGVNTFSAPSKGQLHFCPARTRRGSIGRKEIEHRKSSLSLDSCFSLAGDLYCTTTVTGSFFSVIGLLVKPHITTMVYLYEFCKCARKSGFGDRSTQKLIIFFLGCGCVDETRGQRGV